MKPLAIGVIVITILAVMIVNIEAYSPPVCGVCERKKCQEVSCSCGAYKDDCNCCDWCKVCRGEPCRIFAGDVCEEGLHCGHPPGTEFIDRYNQPGTCVSES